MQKILKGEQLDLSMRACPVLDTFGGRCKRKLLVGKHPTSASQPSPSPTERSLLRLWFSCFTFQFSGCTSDRVTTSCPYGSAEVTDHLVIGRDRHSLACFAPLI
jgi:hypothetical protein